jgi:drug/metabolite transporter (DMT)-like permease
VLGGLIVALLAACCYEVAYAVQALEARAIDADKALRASLLVRLAQRRRWVAGTGLSALGAGLQVLALVLAPLSVVQPVLALGLVGLLVLAQRLLGERPGRRDLLGVLAVVAGVTGVALAAPAHAGRAAAGARMGAELAVLAAVALAPYALRGRTAAPWLAVAGAAAGDATAALGMKLAADALHGGTLLAAVGWGALAAATGLLALTAEMSALQRLPATRVAPVIVAAQVLIPVATAPLLLGEGWGATPLGGTVLGACVALVTGGAALLASSPLVGEIVAAAHAPEAVEHDGGGGGQRRE